MCHMRLAFFIALSFAVLLCGCMPPHEGSADDFGAGQAAKALAQAQALCLKGGYEDLPACAQAPPETARALRLAALTALDMEQTFRRLCADDLGSQKCDDMLMSAYLSVQAR